ncbi:MAG: YhbY family RNA-binding protein [Burkholderiaceae bacterium]|jgi:putative YhbY family RNA-binding protein|nr:YhbY family RNA-binding protein [Burkholderiaceae bacterium]
MPALTLTPAQRKQYRSDAHHLDPVVMVGADGLTDAVLKEADAALAAHGLIKVRVLGDDRDARSALLDALADRLNAAPVQHIGKLLVLWRPPAPTTKADREGSAPAPKLVKIVKFSKTGNHRPQVKTVRVLGNQRVTAGGLVKKARKRATSVKKTGV